MKANSLRVITLLAISILLLSGLATAQGPQPPLPSYPPQGLGLPAEARLGTPEFGKPFIRPGVPSTWHPERRDRLHPPRPAGAELPLRADVRGDPRAVH
jgi:hypothetical protein